MKAISSIATIVLLLLACGPTSSTSAVPTAMPVESSTREVPAEIISTEPPTGNNSEIAEYGRLTCAGEFSDDPPDDATWGDYVEQTEVALEALKQITPPTELRDYHNANQAAGMAALEYAKSKPQGDPLNPYEFMAAPQVMAMGMMAGSIADGLPDDVRAELVQAGCSDLERESELDNDPWTQDSVEYAKWQDPMTDEVALFFTAEAQEGYGRLVIRAECDGEAQVFVDVPVYSYAGDEANLLVRFGNETAQEEIWAWEDVTNAPNTVSDRFLTPGPDRAEEVFAKLMTVEKLAVRYSGPDSGSERKAVLFDIKELRDLWEREGDKGCEAESSGP